MRAFKKALLISLIVCSCVGCDQVTKTAAQYHLPSSQPVYLMGDVFQFQYSTNTGAFLGLGARLPDPVRFWSLTVFVGVGGAVVDFMNMGVGNLRTGIFNLADVAIVIGAGTLLAWGLFFRGAGKAKNE
jgi:signal peptidase II